MKEEYIGHENTSYNNTTAIMLKYTELQKENSFLKKELALSKDLVQSISKSYEKIVVTQK